jgi:hypothetical protein
MAITKEITVDKIEVVGDYKAVQVRTATVIKEDDVELTRSFHRHVLQCSTKTGDTWGDTDISGEATDVQVVCNGVWTDAVKSAYQAHVDSQNLGE